MDRIQLSRAMEDARQLEAIMLRILLAAQKQIDTI